MSDEISVPQFEEITDIQTDDLLYIIRGTGSDRDRNIKSQNAMYGFLNLEEFLTLDISSSNGSFDLTTKEALPDGYTVTLQWSGGDPSAATPYTATINTTFTIKGQSAAIWVGQGNGELRLRKKGGNWLLLSTGSWDSFLNGTTNEFVDKFVNGRMLQEYPTTPNISGNSAYTWQYPTPYLLGTVPVVTSNLNNRTDASSNGTGGIDSRSNTQVNIRNLSSNTATISIFTIGLWTNVFL